MQSPKEPKEEQPEGNGPDVKGPAPAPSSAAPAWNPFRSRSKLTAPSEAEPAADSGGHQSTAGGSEPATAKPARPLPVVPTDHDILTSIPSDTIWNNMQQRASEGIPCVVTVSNPVCHVIGSFWGHVYTSQPSGFWLKGKLL